MRHCLEVDDIRMCAVRSRCLETLKTAIAFHECISGNSVLPSKLLDQSMGMGWLEGCKYLLKRNVNSSSMACEFYEFADFELIKTLKLKCESFSISSSMRCASKNPNLRVLKWVISRPDFDTSKFDITGVFDRDRVPPHDCVLLLFEKGFLEGNEGRVLWSLLRCGSLKTILHLMEKGGGVYQREVDSQSLHYAVSNTANPDVLRYLLENFELDVNFGVKDSFGRSYSPLARAVCEKAWSICRILLKHGACR